MSQTLGTLCLAFILVVPVYLVWKYDWLGIFMTVFLNQILLTVSIVLPSLLFSYSLTDEETIPLQFTGWITSGSYSLIIWLIKHFVLLWKKNRS